MSEKDYEMKASTLILFFVVLFLTLIINVLGGDYRISCHSGYKGHISPRGGCLDTIEMGASVEVEEAIKGIADKW